ncbi:MAG: FAD:protein FMN transferase [Actinomycetia bacterium]|nr:FAD:protein FMN transferase [Actinomycetes bacterium]
MQAAELQVEEFQAMGSPCRLVVVGGSPTLVSAARHLLARLERAWSRFDPSSEISQLNRASGRLTIVSTETFELVKRAEVARDLTGGRFNPLMLTQLEQLGYDRPWQCRPAQCRPAQYQPLTEVLPGSQEEIELIPEIMAVRLPEGTTFDPGGIGKGLAIDQLTEFLIAQGATTVSVELGGDLRVHGRCWYGPRWRVDVAHPHHADREIAAFTPDHGAVTTSSILRRNWSTDQHRLHHLLDPTTGLPSTSDIVAVTTCAGAAWWSEVAAKTALLGGSAEAIDLLQHYDVAGIVVTDDGTVLQTGPTQTANSVEGILA